MNIESYDYYEGYDWLLYEQMINPINNQLETDFQSDQFVEENSSGVDSFFLKEDGLDSAPSNKKHFQFETMYRSRKNKKAASEMEYLLPVEMIVRTQDAVCIYIRYFSPISSPVVFSFPTLKTYMRLFRSVIGTLYSMDWTCPF